MIFSVTRPKKKKRSKKDPTVTLVSPFYTWHSVEKEVRYQKRCLGGGVAGKVFVLWLKKKKKKKA